MMQFKLYSKPGCHLCDEMKTDLLKITSGTDIQIVEVNINSDEQLAEKYGARIPLLEQNGRIISKFRLNVDRVRKLCDSIQAK